MANHLDLEEQEQLDQLKHFWATWGTLISSLLTVLLLGLAGWNGYQYWQARQATQASALFDAVEAAANGKDAVRLEQAFADMRSKHGGTTQAAQAGLLVGKMQEEAEKLDQAKEALQWVATSGSGEGYKAIARLRLSGILLAQGTYDQALAQLTADFPPEFAATVADRKGDIYSLQEKREEAIAQYKLAYGAFAPSIEYRRLVEVKLNAMGVRPDSANIDVSKGAEK